MLTPELVEEFVLTFNAEITKPQHRAVTDQASVAKELDKVERRLDGVLRAIEDGAWNETLRNRLTELGKDKAALTIKMQAAEAPAPQVHLHLNAAGLYRDKVANLQASLNAPDIRLEAAAALRELIEKVVLTPDPDAPDGLRAELHGDLAVLLSLSEPEPSPRRQARSGPGRRPGTSVRGSLLSVVAGTRYNLCRTRLVWSRPSRRAA